MAPTSTSQTIGAVKALLLDMDGTLVNSDAVVERCWRRWAAEHGLDGDSVIRVVHGRQGQATMAVLLPDRPHEENLADNARMLAWETSDVAGVVPVAGAPAFMAALARLPHGPWSPRPTAACPRPGWTPPRCRCRACGSPPSR